MSIKCAVCGTEWPTLAGLEIKGFMAGFDGQDHPILIQQRVCKCTNGLSAPCSRGAVLACVSLPGPIGLSATQALLDLELHLRGLS